MGKKYKIQNISSGFITCNSCGELKSLENYYYHSKGYYLYRCKTCRSKQHKEVYVRKEKKIKIKFLSPERILFNQGLKTCKTCCEVKPFEEFSKKIPTRLTISNCYKCDSKIRYEKFKIRLINNPKIREKKKENVKRYVQKNKDCEKYKQRKRANKERYKVKKFGEEFIIRKENKRIKIEELNKQKDIRRIERERVLDKKRKIKELKEEENRKRKEYYNTDEYKEIVRQKNKEVRYNRWKRRWNEDELFAMKVRLRNLIRNSFRKQGYKKFDLNTESIVGVTYNYFKEYLESKFLEGMTWENRGEWHIDHIIPLSSAVSKDDLIRLCHYTNLQPLWAIDNIKKGNKIL